MSPPVSYRSSGPQGPSAQESFKVPDPVSPCWAGFKVTKLFELLEVSKRRHLFGRRLDLKLVKFQGVDGWNLATALLSH